MAHVRRALVTLSVLALTALSCQASAIAASSQAGHPVSLQVVANGGPGSGGNGGHPCCQGGG